MKQGVPSICDLNLQLSDSLLSSLRDKAAVASIRPEHIEICLAGNMAQVQDSHIRIPVSLQYRSFAGRELRLTALTPDGATIQFITEPRPEYLELEENTLFHLRIRKNRISFFQTDEDGTRLS